MLTRIVLILSTLLFSSGILFASVLRAASINYAFAGKPAGKETGVFGNTKTAGIDYTLPYPGRILPDSPLWPIKALRDKLWLAVTTSSTKQAELKLLFADKRIGMAKTLFEKNKPEIGFSVLTKAEKYLEESSELEKKNRTKGMDTSDFLTRLAKASLKHREVIEKEILSLAPEDARPRIVVIESYAKDAFGEARDGLQSRGLSVPNNPFNGQ